jgi:S1-like
MSFQKNPPWQKNVAMPNFQQQMNLQQLNQLGFLQNQLGFPNAQPMMQMSQLASMNQVPSVQYSTTRVNPMAFQQQPGPQQSNNQGMQQQRQQQQQSQSKYDPSSKVFSGTGIVTKIQNDIGFIDDEVLFHKNVCVKGITPKLSDLCLVEAAYNHSMPFKWNATRVQVLTKANANSPGASNMHQSNLQQSNKNYNSIPPPRDSSNSDGFRNRRFSPQVERRKSPERRPRSRDRRDIDVRVLLNFFQGTS